MASLPDKPTWQARQPSATPQATPDHCNNKAPTTPKLLSFAKAGCSRGNDSEWAFVFFVSQPSRESRSWELVDVRQCQISSPPSIPRNCLLCRANSYVRFWLPNLHKSRNLCHDQLGSPDVAVGQQSKHEFAGVLGRLPRLAHLLRPSACCPSQSLDPVSVR